MPFAAVRPFPTRNAWCLLALALLLCAPLAALHAAAAWRTASPVDLEVVDRDTGRALSTYAHGGRTWLPGEPGHRYAVRLHNRSGGRLLAVLSVDGINAIDGRTADPRQAGYVLEPWQTLEVAGWRKSLDDVAQFVFVDSSASYAARTGRPDNVGVIGVAVFREKRIPYRPGPARVASATAGAAAGEAHAEARAAAPGTSAADAYAGGQGYPQASLGTGHGAREDAPAIHTHFVRERSPLQVTELRYEVPEALLARGVRLAPEWRRAQGGAWEREPRAFPGGFVPDPR
ncbi:hypothetical protein [Pseudoxanthomonas sp. 10H]|uniref:hypothetical protein n=1 Tax=Pseudoxanthomonas sp. 10H TaxID=3242729 RepID=UPI003558E25C